MRAILLGSTGLVGSLALKILSECKEIDSIFTVSRRAPKVEGSKIDSVIEKDSDVWGDIIRKQKDNDVFISAFGTTKKLAGGNEGFLKIDYGINYDAAKAAKDAGVKTFVLVSSGAASSLSPFFYLKTKGKLEDDIVALKFPRTIIIRPGVLLGEREASHGFFESSLVKVALLVKNSVFAFPLYPAYDEEVAKAAIFTALEPLKSTEPEVVIVLGTEVNKTAKEYDAKYSGST
ncbi:Protein fmp52, mitochondrial [Naganishia cerealis]|uniref:Protein fmp52, mitochondrial n=1 Tax=Naganishia cerealis TaxID=610337 RepID=A0ACC2WQV0_9TREE|nr:Protein fmp52, mitochondrial [Naganishia cerealis]